MLEVFGQSLTSGIILGVVYGLIGMGFSLIYNATDVVNFAQGDFSMVGGVVAAGLVTGAHLPIGVAVIGGGIGGALVGILMERLTINPVKRSSIVSMVIITLGVSTIIESAAELIVGSSPISLPQFTQGGPLQFGGISIPYQSLWVVAVAVALMIALSFFFRASRYGRAMLACAIDRRAAELVGIPPRIIVMSAFAISGALSALGGAVLTPLYGTYYDIGLGLATAGFAAAVIGGMGNVMGAAVGGIIIGIISSIGAGLGSSAYKNVYLYVILLLVLMLRPGGLFSARESAGHTEVS